MKRTRRTSRTQRSYYKRGRSAPRTGRRNISGRPGSPPRPTPRTRTVFVPKNRPNLPRDHDLATDHAEELLLASVRPLLDLHYEARLRDAELERLRKQAAERARAGKAEDEEDADQTRRKTKQARSRVLAKTSEALAESVFAHLRA